MSCLPCHAYTSNHIHQKGDDDRGTSAEFAGDGLGAEAGAAGHGFGFALDGHIDHDGAVDADVLDRYDDAVAIAVEKHSASILSDCRSGELLQRSGNRPYSETLSLRIV